MSHKALIAGCIISALISVSASTRAADSPEQTPPIETVPTALNDFKIKVTIKDDLGGIWYILDKQDEGTPQERYSIKPTRQPDGSIKKLKKGSRMWVERVSPQSVKLSLKISNFDQVKTFLLDKTPTNKEQCQTFLLGDKTDDNTTICISIPTSTKQEQGLW